MKLILNTNSPHTTYYIYLPNHVDVDSVEQLIASAKWELPEGTEITHHYLNSDGLTNDERKQLDIYSEVKYPLIKLNGVYVGK